MSKVYRVLAVLLALLLTVSLVGCGESGKETDAAETPEMSSSVEDNGDESPEETDEESTGETDQETTGDDTATEDTEVKEEFESVNDVIYALDRLNVRTKPSTDSEIIGVLEPGEPIPRNGIGEEWMRVKYMGKTAYVSAAYVSETRPTSQETTEEETTSSETVDSPSVSEGTGIFYDNGGYLVAIDPGHQGKGNSEQEPIGPGASETKAKVSSGTQGVVTGIPEHEMNLVVSLYLRDELLARGYSVLMIRETKDVNISNAERAQLANRYDADAFVRIHGNSVSNQQVKGALTMCMTANNPYNGELYEASHTLSDLVTRFMCEATGAVNKGILETDTMSGINWCEVPVTIVEMGFMSNPEEDRAMAEDSYRRALAKGIADGIDAYFEQMESEN